MDILVTTGSLAMCSMGMAPAPLMFLPPPVILAPTPPGTIVDIVPFLNIMPFGMCTSLANPMVAAATAAAFGVLIPMPCIPVPLGPWAPGSTQTMIGGLPALGATNFVMCAWAGKISVSSPTQQKVMAA